MRGFAQAVGASQLGGAYRRCLDSVRGVALSRRVHFGRGMRDGATRASVKLKLQGATPSAHVFIVLNEAAPLSAVCLSVEPYVQQCSLGLLLIVRWMIACDVKYIVSHRSLTYRTCTSACVHSLFCSTYTQIPRVHPSMSPHITLRPVTIELRTKSAKLSASHPTLTMDWETGGYSRSSRRACRNQSSRLRPSPFRPAEVHQSRFQEHARHSPL